MSSSDFRQITARTEAGRAERLFRAAISAFCSLTRPSRRELAQIDDLVLPLFGEVSPEGLRFAAAALCECEYAPPGIVKRLAGSPVEIAAPLLVRSRALDDVDLIALIGHHGLPHARAIARRKDLNPAIASLIRALERQAQATRAGNRVEAVRQRLRELMGEQAAGAEPSNDSRPDAPQAGAQGRSALR